MYFELDNDGMESSKRRSMFISLLLPPQGFGPEAKTRGGSLGFPACIHDTRVKKIC